MSATAPDLLPLLVVDGGPIWQMKWAPGASTWISGVDDDDVSCIDDDVKYFLSKYLFWLKNLQRNT